MRKIDPGFHRQQLSAWHRQGYITPLVGGYYALAVDVAPFLISKEQVRRVVKFREFWKQVDMD